MTIALAITTAPRPTPTLERSLASLRAAGCTLAPILVDDPRSRQGIVKTWALALRRLEATGADLLVLAQDDVTWPAGGWDQALEETAALAAAHPDLGYASLYTSGRVLAALRDRYGAQLVGGWWPTGDLPIRWSGAQCYILPWRAAHALLRCRRFGQIVATERKSIDVFATAALNRLGCPTWTRVPSLIDHHQLGGSGNSAQRRRWRRRAAP